MQLIRGVQDNAVNSRRPKEAHMSKQPVSEGPLINQFGPNGVANPADEKEFRELFDWWKRDTAPLSSASAIVGHPAYEKIIAMGQRALPLMLQATRDHGTVWFGAPERITKVCPAPEGAKPKARREAWLKWGKEKGLI
jgi:hypothetical protein